MMESGIDVDGAARDAARKASALLGLSSTVCNVTMHKYKAGEAHVAFGEEQGAPSFGCKLGLMAELLKETLNADSAFVVHLTPAPHCDPAEVGIGAHVATAGSPDAAVISDKYPEELVQLALANLSERDPIYEVPDGGAALAGRELEPGRAASIAEKVGAGSCIWRLCSAFGTPWALVAVHSRAPGRPFTAENRAVLGAVGDCVGMSLALVWASEPSTRRGSRAAESASPVAWPGAPKPSKRPSLREAVAGAGPMEGLLRVLEDLGCDCAAIDRTALAALAAEIELSFVASGKHAQAQDPTRDRAVASATLEELSLRAQTLQGQLAERTTRLESWLLSEALLRDIARDMRAQLSLREILRDVAGRIRDLFQADVVAIHSVSEGEEANSSPVERYYLLRSGTTEVEESVLTPHSSAVLRRVARTLTMDAHTSFYRNLAEEVPAEDFASIVAWAEPLGVHCAIERALELAEQARALRQRCWRLRARALTQLYPG
eukprot:tig00001178_g7383.t1